MIRKNMTNGEIYNIATEVAKNLTGLDLSLPVRVNFYLQKNTKEIMDIARDIESNRDAILDKYGKRNEDGSYQVNDGELDQLNKELGDLFDLEQEVKIYEIDLAAFDGVNLTTSQVNAITFMIKEEEE